MDFDEAVFMIQDLGGKTVGYLKWTKNVRSGCYQLTLVISNS